jgi:intracellular sulfur oxidation DsrE/DsrF family protein
MFKKYHHSYTRFILSIVTCLSFLVVFHASAEATSPTKEAASSTREMIKVPSDGRYKVVYDIRTDAVAAGVNRGLYYARGLIEAFKKQGVKPVQLDIHLVMHGKSIKSLLIEDTYQMVSDDPFANNPNAELVETLLESGVSLEICHSVMKSKGWTEKDVLPNVHIVHDGYTRIIKLQNDGYAYIGGF